MAGVRAKYQGSTRERVGILRGGSGLEGLKRPKIKTQTEEERLLLIQENCMIQPV